MKYEDILIKGVKVKEDSAKFFKNNKLKGKKLDQLFHTEHDKAFAKIDCLDCANCCKTTSPIFRDIDIKRISKNLKTSEKNFISNYLHLDEDKDYVLNSSPCAFLDQDNNKCNIYEVRPLACRDYPHTNRKNMHQIMDLTQKNLDVCPAVIEIVDKIVNNS
ncbi:MAG: YkgJ family cysteine cluster protein [Crocinitomicaceae bacterium]|jgi:Fe-S-cluster containining protein|nr:YkgJ family cysteine cluster protein [Crocinitomicaceae bacterium]